jgi:hypothetical protein
MPDLLERIRDEYNSLRNQLQNARLELEKQAHEREAFQRQSMMTYEMIYSGQMEVCNFIVVK